jgi:hypothetical protein
LALEDVDWHPAPVQTKHCFRQNFPKVTDFQMSYPLKVRDFLMFVTIMFVPGSMPVPSKFSGQSRSLFLFIPARRGVHILFVPGGVHLLFVPGPGVM